MSARQRRSSRRRSDVGPPIVAWILIVLGLAGIVGGAGMIYVLSIAEGADRARAQATFGADPMSGAPPRSDGTFKYLIGVPVIVGGLVLTVLGLGRRGLESGGGPARGRGAEAASKVTCPSCGGRSPETAAQCYHCGHAF
jgi:hypothetical protein